MAKDEMHNGAPQARVYKANAVHKRRAGKAVLSHGDKPDADISSAETELDRSAVQGAEIEDAVEAADCSDDKDSPSDSEPIGMVKEAVDANESAQPSSEAVLADETDGERENLEARNDDSTDSREDYGDDGEGAPPERKRRTADPRTLAKRIAIAVVAVLVISAVALASYFAWDRWGRYDDVSEIQGEWFIDGTATSIVIDGKTMQLADAVAYSYEINPQEKTIRFWFGSWEGEGRYRFSDDRQRLLIIDGQYSGVGTLFDDLLVPFDAMASAGSQQPTTTSQGELAAATDSGSSAEPSSSGESQLASDQATSPVQATEQAPESTSGLGQDVSLFNRQADPEALKAKEAAEQAAKAKAEREAKEAAEAEAAEAVEYGYYGGYEEYDEYDESSEYAYDEEGSGEDDQSNSDDEEEWA